MSVDKFRFVSPGVQVAEIDQSRRTRAPADPGPVIVGKFERGPTMRPVKVDSLNELEEVFGATITGRESGDISRNGNFSAPSYAAFAANAWLANNGGATIIRTVGKENSSLVVGSGEAGWTVTTTGTAGAGRGGAWGLWVIPSGSDKEMTGTLGAIFYCNEDTGIVLSGTVFDSGSTTAQGAGLLVKATSNIRAKVITGIADASSSVGGTEEEDVSFNFDPSSRLFIRKVFNTTPHNTNTSVVAASHQNSRNYWLGETFEDRVRELQGTGTTLLAFTAPLVSGSSEYYDHTFDAQPAKTGWVISQDTSADTGSYSPANMQKLFRFVTMEEAEWSQRNLKISIRNIRLPNTAQGADPYGSFEVQIRKIGDSDAAPETVEVYTGLNLNPASPNYIAARIGDQRAVWSDTEKRYRYFGNYPNVSKYIYVEMSSEVDEGSITQELVPFGFYGLPKPATVSIEGVGSDGDGDNAYIQSFSGSAFITDGNNAYARANQMYIAGASTTLTASLEWPAHRLVASAAMSSLSDPTDRYFGVDFTRHNSDTLLDQSVYDIAKARAKHIASDNWDTSAQMVYSDIFSLDDVSSSVDGITSNGYVYVSGSRAAGTSKTAADGDPEAIIDAGYDKFTMPLYGGFDGLEVAEMEPIANNRLLSGKTVANSYEKHTLIRAIDTVADAELVDMNLLVVPGVTDTGITDHMINTCERRRDAMAIIDIPNAYTPRHESSETSESARNASSGANKVTTAVSSVKQKGYNTSYAACYYPWVQVSAPVSGIPTWVPPSVVALGAMSYGEATQAVWFAPAGFTRGGLSAGRGGLSVLAVSQRLSSKERDSLYEVNVNPIAQFPAEGIVIFGQKTLQAVPSALDRINVRRLLIFIKKRISTIASTLLFDPNVVTTWARFTSRVEPFLEGVKANFGLEDFRVVLDSTTTTDDLVDRNTMYAKIYVKPTKAIEFIAIDFVITNQGASFDD